MPCTKESLLIVDDEPSIRESLSWVLTEIGYSVRVAEDGLSALHRDPEGDSGYDPLRPQHAGHDWI